MINYRFFGSYLSDRYEAFAHVRNFNMVNSENGGLTNDRYVTHPDDFENGKRGIDSRSFPTRLTNTWNRVRSRQFFLSHRYNLGFYRRMTSGELERRKQREEEKQRRLAEADEQAIHRKRPMRNLKKIFMPMKCSSPYPASYTRLNSRISAGVSSRNIRR